MAKYRTEDIRNVILVGHGGAGKTTLADTVLHRTKAVDRLGSVDDGTSISDYDDEEKLRKKSIDATFLHCDWKNNRLNLIDTPGFPDFIGACFGVLDAAETALVMVDASAGIQVNTRRVFREASERGMGRIIVLNKLDAENINFAALDAIIQETFGKQCVLLNAPVGLGEKLTGVVDVLHPPDALPAGIAVDIQAERSRLLDVAVESNEELMMRYLEGEQLSDDEIRHAVAQAVQAGKLVPIVCISARKQIGVDQLLDTITTLALKPTELQRTLVRKEGDANVTVPLEPKPDGEPIALVVKTVTDPFVGRLSYVRVFTGKIVPETPVLNVRNNKPTKMGHLLSAQGKQLDHISDAIAGDIIAVAKVEDLLWGDTLGAGAHGAHFAPSRMPIPMVSQAVQPKARGDEGKISTSLAKIVEEDPTFKVRRDAETKEMVISGMSELHLDVVRSKLRRRFQLEMDVKPPRIPYRETITVPAEAMYRHKKQTGGAGQFGEVHLRVHPLPRGGVVPDDFITKERFPSARDNSYHEDVRFLFIDSIVGGTIPNQYIPSVEKGVRKAIETGIIAGYTIQDVAVEVFFGKSHPVDSKDIAFQIAGEMAFKEAFHQARPVILEPIVNIEITVPTTKMGDIISDMSTRRGRIQGSDTLPGNLSSIKAQVPLAEVVDYARGLGSMTGGQGSYTLEPSHYDMVPGNVQQTIIDKAKKAREEHAAHV